MGLDSVELLMSVEKHFGINIPDKEAETILTVNDFANCVYRYVNINSDAKCKSQYLFYILRSYFVEEYSFDKTKFTPSTKLNEIFPLESRQDRWEKLFLELDLELPKLRKTDINPDTKGSLFASLFVSKRPQIGEYQVRDLVNWMLSQNYRQLINVHHLFSKEEVTRVVIGIISETQGIAVEDIQPYHKISYDLGID